MAFLDPLDAAQRRRRYWIAAGSVLATTTIMTLFLIESRWGYMKPDPVIIYAQSWKPEEGMLKYDWQGYNEAILVYVLALGSPTHAVGEDA